jgi:hypothetical protein
MNREGRSISMGMVIGLGFILLGILNLFAFLNYKRTSINVTSRIPAVLLILTGLTIIIVRAIRKKSD